MALYELRTYTLYVGKMAEATKLYQELGFPALNKGGHDKKLVGYFQGDTGTINQIVHLWKFDDDADRRKHWAGVFANKEFVEGFASKFRPLVMTLGGQAADGRAVGSTSVIAAHTHDAAPIADEVIEYAALCWDAFRRAMAHHVDGALPPSRRDWGTSGRDRTSFDPAA